MRCLQAHLTQCQQHACSLAKPRKIIIRHTIISCQCEPIYRVILVLRAHAIRRGNNNFWNEYEPNALRLESRSTLRWFSNKIVFKTIRNLHISHSFLIVLLNLWNYYSLSAVDFFGVHTHTTQPSGDVIPFAFNHKQTNIIVLKPTEFSFWCRESVRALFLES